MASLFVIQGRDQGRRFELGEATVGLGRDPKNTVQLHDSEVSRRHAQIVHRPEGFFLADLGSSNGTIVNGGPIREQPLRSGDRIQLGRTLMIFTGNEDKSSLDLAAEVDIFDGGRQAASSRIVTTVGQEQGGSPPAEGDFMSSPWLARTRSNLQIMYQTALAVSHTLDIDQLLQSLMEFIFEWVEADRGCIMLLDRETSSSPRSSAIARGSATASGCGSARRSWTT